MSLILLGIIQWLHILMGIAWFGGYIFCDFVLWPMLLSQPAEKSRPITEMLGKYAGPVMATSGTLVPLLGIIRGTVFGPINSFGFLFTSAYGITWLVALIITILLSVWGAGLHDRVVGPVFLDDDRAQAARRIWASTIFEMLCFSIVLACMVLMHLGL